MVPRPRRLLRHEARPLREASCLTRDESKGKAKGKFEQATNTLTGGGGEAQLAIAGVGTVKCESASSEEQLRSPITGESKFSLQGCRLAGESCSSVGSTAGTIASSALEALVYEEGEKLYTAVVGEPALMSFTCDATRYTVSGEASGETTGATNAMASTAKVHFAPGAGSQALRTEDGKGSAETTLELTLTTAGTEALELRTGS
ncbi:MAG TPA: hypothetical protein VMB91_05775 [Solirubrobacteraceae bacterium]|nr:hypothetical protein [Solirubrobacteraceae bacterium]